MSGAKIQAWSTRKHRKTKKPILMTLRVSKQKMT